jgi:hypothetical protein
MADTSSLQNQAQQFRDEAEKLQDQAIQKFDEAAKLESQAAQQMQQDATDLRSGGSISRGLFG